MTNKKTKTKMWTHTKTKDLSCLISFAQQSVIFGLFSEFGESNHCFHLNYLPSHKLMTFSWWEQNIYTPISNHDGQFSAAGTLLQGPRQNMITFTMIFTMIIMIIDQCRSHDHSDHDFELTMDGVTGPAGAHSRPHCE